jgi:hypothetical protein
MGDESALSKLLDMLAQQLTGEDTQRRLRKVEFRTTVMWWIFTIVAACAGIIGSTVIKNSVAKFFQ